MARQLVGLEPEPLYRAVILYKYSGLHDLPMKAYTDASGESHEYHKVAVYGPYETPAPAKAGIKREKRYALKGYSDYIDFKDPQRRHYPVSEVIGLVEDSTPQWSLFLKPDEPIQV